MDESLCLKCIDDAVEGSEIHTTISLSDEFFLEIREGDFLASSEGFDEPFSLFGDTSI